MGRGLHAPRRRTDDNHAAVVQALRDIGCSVQSIASVGRGCPDLLWAWSPDVQGVMEVKDGTKRPSERRLTDSELKWRQQWKGRYDLVESVEEACNVVRPARFQAGVK